MSVDQHPRPTVFVVTEGNSDVDSPDSVLAVYESLADAFAFVEEYDSQGDTNRNTSPFQWEIEAVDGGFHAYCQRTEHTRYHITGSPVTSARRAVEDGAQATRGTLAAV